MPISKLTVSIVLSTYNGEKYILEQLNSLVNQSRKAEEVLIFDDCSTDGTVEIIEAFISNHKLLNWKVSINNENKGWKRNFIEGMKLAKGDLIFPSDQDDIWHDNKLEIMARLMSENDDINVLVSGFNEFYEPSGKKRMCPKRDSGIIRRIPVKKRFMNIEYPGCTYCVRRVFFMEIVDYWDKSFPHDSLIWRMAMFSNSLYAIDSPLIDQRKHPDSTFTVVANNSRNLNAKKNEIIYTKLVLTSIGLYLDKINMLDDKTNKLLEKAMKWTKVREAFFESKNFFLWLNLGRYIMFYQSNKKYLLDLYVVVKSCLMKRDT